MAVRTITTKLALDGEAEYKAKIKNINADLSVYKSELEKITAEHKDNANSLTALGAKYSVMESQLSSLNEKHKEQTDMLEKAQDAYGKYVKEVAELKAKQDELKNSTSSSTEEQEKLKEELAKAEANMEKAANSVNFYQKQLNNTERDQANLSAELDRTKGYLDEASASADGCATSIDQYGKQVKQATEETKDLGDKGTAAMDALAQAIVAAGIAEKVKDVASALYDCVDTFAAFQAQMSTVQAISGATGEEMAALAEKAKYMGATTAFTAAEAGEALEYMAMAGWKTEDMLGGLEGIMNLASASGESLASTSDIVTDALTAFGLAASDSGHFADVLASASSNANTNVSMMGETFKYAAPVAGALGYSIEDVALAVGLMANAGIKGSSAGTALRTTLTNLSKPSNDIASYMEALGVSLTDNQGKMRSLSDLMGLLRDRFQDLSEAEQAEYAAGIAGKEAMSGLLAIVNASEADYEKLAAAINDCNGAALEMSQTKLDNYAGQVTLLNSAIDGLKLTVGEQLEPLLANIASGATTAVSGLTELLEACPGLSAVLTGLVVSAGALAVAFAGFNILPQITAMFTAFNAALAANPLGLLAISMAGVVTALTALSSQTETADAEVKSLTKSIKESRQEYQELTASMEKERSSVTDSVRALKNLLEAENKSTAQKDQILRMVDELNRAVPDLGLAYDAVSDSINMTSDALERMAEASGEQAEYEAQLDRLNELFMERESITRELEDAQNKLNEAMVNAQWNWEGREMNEAAVEADQLKLVIEELTSAQEECAEQITALEEVTASYAQRQEEASASSEEMAAKTEAVTARMESLISQMDTLEAAYIESYTTAMESINQQVGLFEELDGAAKTSIGSLIETLKGQVEYMETYASNIEKAMEMGVDRGLIQKLSDGSEKSAQILASIVQGGEEDIRALNEEFAKVEKGKENFSNTVAEMETDFKAKMEAIEKDLKDAVREMDVKSEAYDIGSNNLQGLIDGTASQKQALIRKYAEMGRAALDAYKREVQQASPSKAFYQAGRFDIQGIVNGAESEKAKLDEAYAGMARTALESMERGLPSTLVEPRAASQQEQTAAIAEAVRNARTESIVPFSAADLAAAVREALSGMSVNLSQRKVGELITTWQHNNDRGRGV